MSANEIAGNRMSLKVYGDDSVPKEARVEVAFAAVADSANVSHEGKLNILGVFDSIVAKAFPAHHPSMAFAFTLRLEYGDQNRDLALDVSLVDQDGRKLWGAIGKVTVGDVSPGQFVHRHQIMNLLGVQFPAPGRYRFRVKLEGRKEPYDTVFQVVEKPGD
jgi:hypothetical protein